jgi:hypothetical protein
VEVLSVGARAQAVLLAAVIVIAALPCEALRKEKLVCVKPVIVGKVVAVKKGKAFFDVGTDHGVEVGARLAVIPASAIETHPEHGTALVCKHVGGVTAVVEIDEADATGSSGRIGRASAATKGDLAFVVEWKPTNWKWWPVFPEAYGNVWEMRLRVHLLPDFYEHGLGFTGQVALSYQFALPIKIQVMMARLIVAHANRDMVGVMPGLLISYSSRFFEVGFGVGAHTNTFEKVHGPALFQTVRLGAENGLMARVPTVFLYSRDEWWVGGPRGLQFDSVFGEVKAPLHQRVTIFMDFWAGGLASGEFRLTGGLQIMVRGTGGPGTVIVPIGAGGGSIDWADPDCDWTTDDDACWDEDLLLMSFILTTGLDVRW